MGSELAKKNIQGVPLPEGQERREDYGDSREALLRHVLAAEAQIQDKGGPPEDVILASLLPSPINEDLTFSTSVKLKM